jgi:hypothetical protein
VTAEAPLPEDRRGWSADVPPRRTWTGRLAASGTRRLIGFARWRGRRDAKAALSRPNDQVFRGFIQINLIRPG